MDAGSETELGQSETGATVVRGVVVASLHRGPLGRPGIARGGGIGVFTGDGEGKVAGKVARSSSKVCIQRRVRGIVVAFVKEKCRVL